MTGLILAIFRLNGRLLLAGDRLVAGLDLTSARWQVLGAIALAERPQPVAWLARNMGLNRQGVQRIVNEMRDDGLLEIAAQPASPPRAPRGADQAGQGKRSRRRRGFRCRG